MAQQEKALANKEMLFKMHNMMEKAMPTIAAVLPKHMTGERMLRITTAAVSRDPLLMECSPLSVVNSVIMASQLGLEPVGPLGQAYLVPFNNRKTGKREAQLIIGYRGMIELSRRSGNIVNIEAHVAHEKDDFNFCFGLDPKLEHRPYMGEDDPGKVVAAYAIARFRDGGYQTDVMSIGEINAIRKRSQASSFGPWITDFDEMARKTVVKRLCKYLPLSVEMAQAIAADNAAESGENQLSALDIDLPEGSVIDTEAEPSKSKSDSIAAKLGVPKGQPDAQGFDKVASRQSIILELLGDGGGLGLTPAEQDAYIKEHSGKTVIGQLSEEEAGAVIAAAQADLAKRDGV